jgi:hypothetical protein
MVIARLYDSWFLAKAAEIWFWEEPPVSLLTALWPCKIIKTVYALSIGGSENGRWERWISGYQKVEGSLRVVQDEVGVWFETRDVVGMPRQPGRED